MSEEEIISVVKNHAQYTNAKVINANTKKEYKVSEALQGLLDLYNKEKEKNKDVRDRIEYYLLNNSTVENNPERLEEELNKLQELLEEDNK